MYSTNVSCVSWTLALTTQIHKQRVDMSTDRTVYEYDAFVLIEHQTRRRQRQHGSE